MRPLAKGPAPAGYLASVPNILAFQGSAANDAQQVYGTANPPLQQCLVDWARQLDLGGAGPSARLAKRVQTRIAPIYRKAGPYLLTQLGAFCSFCESPLPGQLDVEHAIPKSQYPTFAVNWDNFLLACTACNSSKGAKPARASIRADLMIAGNPNPSESDFFNEVRNIRYSWPDLAATGYRNFPIELRVDQGNGLAPVNVQDAINSANTLASTDYLQQRVFANVCINGRMQQNREVAVMHRPVGPPEQQLVDMCDLDRRNPPITDRRVVNRTQAWFTILNAINLHLTPYAPNVPAQRWNSLFDLARLTGFYSLWVHILHATNPVYAMTFVAGTNHAGCYPGTNALQVP